MDLLKSLLSGLSPAIPMGFAIVTFALMLFVVHHIFEKRVATRPQKGLQRQVTMLILTFVGLLTIIVVSPLTDAQKGQLLSLIGLLLSATIALSSTTFLGNALAGFMLRVVRSFRIGDFIRIDDYFGRVSERGLFHTEIQTEDRDLMTLPNLYLATNPVKVIRSSGTIISAEVSLGYDVPREEVEKLLIESAKAADLEDPFVHILALGDFSVTYRISGLLPEVKQVISARSRLRELMLDTLHAGGIEIVSPNFMNTRTIQESRFFIPKAVSAKATTDPEPELVAESLAFDKAEEAESTDKLQMEHDDLHTRLNECEASLKEASTEEEKDRLTKKVVRLREARDRMAELVRKKTTEREE